MKTSFITITGVGFLLAAQLLCATAQAAGKGTIRGQVLGVTGEPVVGVRVAAGSALALTDASGIYTLLDVEQKKDVPVTFRRAGYGSTETWVDFEPRSSTGKKSKLASVTVNKTLLAAGVAKTINNAAASVVVEAGHKVTFAPGSLNRSGDVAAVVTPVDLSVLAQRRALPGHYIGQSLAGKLTDLALHGAMEVSLTQNGASVNIVSGGSAAIELLLPVTTPLSVGTKQSMWYYDVAAGIWQEQGKGLVGQSTAISGRKAVFASVSHFTWWVAGVAAEALTYVSGRVVDTSGTPLEGLYTHAQLALGQSYGYSAEITSADGTYCLSVPTNSVAVVQAFASVQNLVGVQSSIPVTTNALPGICGDGTGVLAPDIVLDTNVTSCVLGSVKDTSGIAVVGLTVFSYFGGTGLTDVRGQFLLRALPNQQTTLVPATSPVGYFPAVTVTTGSPGMACAIANFLPAPTNNTCVIGRVFYIGEPVIPVLGLPTLFNTYDLPVGSNGPVGSVGVGDASGFYCAEGLPANTNVAASYSGILGRTTSATPGSCLVQSSCANFGDTLIPSP